ANTALDTIRTMRSRTGSGTASTSEQRTATTTSARAKNISAESNIGKSHKTQDSLKTAIRFVAFLAIVFFSIPAAAQAPIQLRVDATEAAGKIYHAELTIPAAPGPLNLFYPKWIPGEHAPTGPITDLAGLKFSAGGQTLQWTRDAVEMFEFHL